VDAAKTPASLLHMFREFFQWVVPQGWILWQDYVSATCPWIHLALEELADYFEYWDSPEGGTSSWPYLDRGDASGAEPEEPALYNGLG